MKIRAALLSSLLAVGVLASASSAAPPCNLITDAAGDAGPVQSANLDILSGDIASDGKRITAVIRTASLSGSEATAPTGFAYNLRFKAPGVDQTLYFLARLGEGGAPTFEYGSLTGPAGNQLTAAGDALGVVDEGKKEIRITAPISFGGLVTLKPGLKLTNLTAISQRLFVVLLSGADSTDATTSKPYTTGSESCVKVGA